MASALPYDEANRLFMLPNKEAYRWILLLYGLSFSAKSSAYRLAMSPELNQLRLEQLQSTLSSYADLVKRQTPSRGWLKLIREALGRTERQQAQKLGISGATLHKSEQSEAEDRITLGQLRKLADGLDCELVYALVPRRPLTEVVQERARAIAMEEVGGVAHTMSLEDQRPGAERLRKQVERRTEELLLGRWSDLWR
jgi:predicted DNA-binding mobile mystery protein A